MDAFFQSKYAPSEYMCMGQQHKSALIFLAVSTMLLQAGTPAAHNCCETFGSLGSYISIGRCRLDKEITKKDISHSWDDRPQVLQCQGSPITQYLGVHA